MYFTCSTCQRCEKEKICFGREFFLPRAYKFSTLLKKVIFLFDLIEFNSPISRVQKLCQKALKLKLSDHLYFFMVFIFYPFWVKVAKFLITQPFIKEWLLQNITKWKFYFCIYFFKHQYTTSRPYWTNSLEHKCLWVKMHIDSKSETITSY